MSAALFGSSVPAPRYVDRRVAHWWAIPVFDPWKPRIELHMEAWSAGRGMLQTRERAIPLQEITEPERQMLLYPPDSDNTRALYLLALVRLFPEIAKDTDHPLVAHQEGREE